MKKVSLNELDFQFDRSSGPGGQKVNKSNTKVTLLWYYKSSQSIPKEVLERFRLKYAGRINQQGQVVVQSDKYRSQNRNKEFCIKKLNEMLSSVWYPSKKRKKTKPSKKAKEQRLKEKKRLSEKKQSRQKLY